MNLGKLPKELLKAFKDMCRENEWTEDEVLEHLLQWAIAQDYKLAFPIHKFRIRKEKGIVWQNPRQSDCL